MRTSGKRMPGSAMRFHSASFTVLVTGTIMPRLAIAVLAIGLRHPVEAHESAEFLEVVERRRDRLVRLELAVDGFERRAGGKETERRVDRDPVADGLELSER